ncbi:hypothetical protein EJ08DRAFT_713837 [Tothia fuscella]|uniref:Uncharacterized protein n=1 Tax=Tothia fuscella TaxID=1048955 RepID=A0A9P4TR74_9PEZI|nr:hypothetical protein EJ08DRAFT_713837 [Tothia fuscella]
MADGVGRGDGDETDSEAETRQEEQSEREERLDQAVLDAAVSLIRQRLDRRAFDSAIVSFAAVRAWDPAAGTWVKVGNYTPYLSHLIYGCQLLALLYCLRIPAVAADEQPLTDYLVRFRDQWLLNDTPRPVAELLGTRLLGFEIARNTVNQAQVRWHADGETIAYGDVQLQMGQLRGLVRHELDTAQELFARDLCFGLKGVPECPLEALVDN